MLEQILADNIQQEPTIPDADNWFETIINSVNNLFSLLYVLIFNKNFYSKFFSLDGQVMIF